MFCPFCKNKNTSVYDSRANKLGQIRRRRTCLKCKKNFITLEALSKTNLFVMKDDETIELFDKEKIFSCIYHICKKSKISAKTFDEIYNTILDKIDTFHTRQIKTKRIKEIVCQVLEKKNQNLYQRFCVIYNVKPVRGKV